MDNAQCLVSVLCTAYNHEKYLREALDGMLAQQTDFPFEILINDDASTDGTADIIRDYAARYPDKVRPFYQEENLFSRHVDIYRTVFYPNCRGRYLAICEGDDYWRDPEKLQKQADFMEAHPEYSACVHNTTLHYCAGDKPDRPLLADEGEGDVPLKSILDGMSHSYHTSSLFAKRSIMTEPNDCFGIWTEYGFYDHPWALCLIREGPIRRLEGCMSVYRINSGAASWSSGVDEQYRKLRHYTRGECELLRRFCAQAPESFKDAAEAARLEKEFELMYIEGRDMDQRLPPYDALLREMPLKYRAVNALKCLFPSLQRMYRRRRGFSTDGQ